MVVRGMCEWRAVRFDLLRFSPTKTTFHSQMTSFFVHYDVIYYSLPVISQYLKMWGADSPVIVVEPHLASLVLDRIWVGYVSKQFHILSVGFIRLVCYRISSI